MIGIAITVAVFGVYLLISAGTRKQKREQSIEQVLHLLIPSLKGGADLATAIALVAELGPAGSKPLLRKLQRDLAAGVPEQDVLNQFADRFQCFEADSLQAIVTVFDRSAIQRERALERLETLCSEAREFSRRQHNIGRAATVGTLMLLICVPMLFLGCWFFGPDYAEQIKQRPEAQGLLVVAAVLQLMAAYTIWVEHRLLRCHREEHL